MIDKIDRIDAPPPYRINEAKQTKEDRHQQQNPKEELEKQYQKQIAGDEWSKFGRRTTVIKPVKVPRVQIARCILRGANLHSGIGLMQVDIRWRDGRQTTGALMLLTRLEDFIRIKKIAPGQDVPEEFWAKGETVEIGIVQSISDTGGFSGQDLGGKAARPLKSTILERAGLLDRKKLRTNWGIIILVAFIVVLAIAAIVVMLL